MSGRRGYGRARWELTTTARGRRSPTRCWIVRTASGDRVYLSGLQLAAYRWMTWQHEHGRHRYRVRDLADAIGAGPGTASKILRRLRSLSLVGGRHPHRGRYGHVVTWSPRARSQERDAAIRRVRWPTRANDSTFTTFGGYLSREGLRRSFSTMTSGRPPGSAGPPGGWAAGSSSPRARGRPWPPAIVTERCPSTGRSAALRLVASVGGGPDLGLVFGGRCSKGHHDHAAAVVLCTGARTELESAGRVAARMTGRRSGGDGPVSQVVGDAVDVSTPAASARQVELAAGLVPGLDEGIADELRVRYLGWSRQAPYVPILPAVVTGAEGTAAELVDELVERCRLELELVRAARRPLPPA